MTNSISVLFIAVLLIGNALPSQPLTAQSPDSEDSRFLIDNFEDDSIGSLPAEWYERNGEKKLLDLSKEDQDRFKYRVLKERGNKYLKYEGIQAKHINYPLANKSGIDIYKTPVLSWKARAWELPENANEESDSRNDAVMSLYVVFDFGRVALVKKVPKSIRYTWSTTLEKGSEHSRLFGNQKIVVVESGRDRVGEWVTFERNIVEDYRRLYGDDPPAKPLALLILSDGDSTDSKAEADYDDIQLKQRSQPTGNTD